MNTLRADKQLKSHVIQQLKKFGLGSDLSESSPSGDSSSLDSSSDERESDSKSSEYKGQACAPKRKSKKSGMVSKPTDRVRFPHILAQSALHFDPGSPCQFENFNFNKLVAGELEIITSPKISKVERNGRLRVGLLKKLALYAENFDITTIRGIYLGVLRQIELGMIDWKCDFSNAEQMAITKSLGNKGGKRVKTKGTEQSDNPKLTWFCHNYNKDKCSQKSDYTGMVKGKNRYLKHICAICYLRDKTEMKHPESSSVCPHFKE